jgi:hypothetical protein
MVKAGGWLNYQTSFEIFIRFMIKRQNGRT